MTSFELAIEIFSIHKTLISDHFDKLAFSLNEKFTDDVTFSHVDTLTRCPLVHITREVQRLGARTCVLGG